MRKASSELRDKADESNYRARDALLTEAITPNYLKELNNEHCSLQLLHSSKWSSNLRVGGRETCG